MYPNMKRIFVYITLPLLLVCTAVSAQETVSPLDSVDLGNLFRLQANGNPDKCQAIFEKSPEVDIANALYGQFSTPRSCWWTAFPVRWTT